MFASAIHALLLGGEQPEQLMRPAQLSQFEQPWLDSPERQRVLEAVVAGDDSTTDLALEALLLRMAPEALVLQQIFSSGRFTRQLELARRTQGWAAQESAGRSDASREETRELNSLLRGCFARVCIVMDRWAITIVAHRRTDRGPLPIEVQFEHRDYFRHAPESRRTRVHKTWEDSEMLDALRTWAKEHGRSPKLTDWFFADPDRPTCHTVRRRFGSWRKALRRAGLKPAARVSRYSTRKPDERYPGAIEG